MVESGFKKSGGMGSYFPPKCWKRRPLGCRARAASPPLASLPLTPVCLSASIVSEKMSSSRRLSCSSCPGGQLPQLAANYPRPPPLSLLQMVHTHLLCNEYIRHGMFPRTKDSQNRRKEGCAMRRCKLDLDGFISGVGGASAAQEIHSKLVEDGIYVPVQCTVCTMAQARN